MASPASAIALKSVVADDEPVLFAIYAAVRTTELRLDQWPAAARDQMLRMQFEAQRRGYREQFPLADQRLILRQGRPVGWVIVDRSGPALHAIDVALLEPERGQGVGTQALRLLQAEAAAAGSPMVLSVQRFNERAIAFYRRLGFRSVRETDVQTVMEWSADDAQ